MYVVFEGIEGSGKTIQILNVEKFLKNKGFSFILTKEPGSTEIGNEIRKILLNSSFSQMSFLAEIFLYIADRAEHYDKIIKKNIDKVDIIISDRSLYSNIVYQGYGRGMDLKLLKKLNMIVTENILPDYVFLFDCSVETGLKRALKREYDKNSNETRFEMEQVEFHKRVREGFLELASKSENWIVINSERNIENVSREVIEHFKSILKPS